MYIVMTGVWVALAGLLLTAPASYAADRHRDEAFLPAHRASDIIVEHAGYTLSYSEKDEQAIWVAYELTAAEVRGRLRRSDNFREDPDVASGSAAPADYQGTGYDRGHLAPAADMEWSKEVMSESFYMSNMSPQKPDFNRGRWKDLEEQVRRWAQDNGALFVITGPALNRPPLGVIGRNGVTVPASYYKVIVDAEGPDIKGIGFLMPNAGLKETIASYAVSIDEIEQVTGLDFFPNLEDRLEQAVEGSIDIAAWPWPGEKIAGGEPRRSRGSSRDGAPARSQERQTPAAETGWGNVPVWVIVAALALILLMLLKRFR